MMAAGDHDLSEQHVRQILRDKGIIDNVLKSLGYSDSDLQHTAHTGEFCSAPSRP
jgi:outer membrane protein OmpA-like peptidoglycan-associated protein